MESCCIHTTGQDFPAVRLKCVISPCKTGYAVKEDNNILFEFHHPLCFFNNHFRNLDVPLRRLIKCRTNDFGVDQPFHICDFLGTFINQEDYHDNLWVVLADAVRNFLEEDCFSCPRLRDD